MPKSHSMRNKAWLHELNQASPTIFYFLLSPKSSQPKMSSRSARKRQEHLEAGTYSQTNRTTNRDHTNRRRHAVRPASAHPATASPTAHTISTTNAAVSQNDNIALDRKSSSGSGSGRSTDGKCSISWIPISFPHYRRFVAICP